LGANRANEELPQLYGNRSGEAAAAERTREGSRRFQNAGPVPEHNPNEARIDKFMLLKQMDRALT
tara:strand:- start:370 stop:564 length:195 start_codon:yes stop_codon:yes gene_type:complete